MKKCFVFGTIASILCLYNTSANATAITCPAGCFCLNEGEVHTLIQEDLCTDGVATKLNARTMDCDTMVLANTRVIPRRNCLNPNSSVPSNTVFIEDFSEFYWGDFGWYGYKNDRFFYDYRPAGNYAANAITDALVCPASYPNSDPGARSLQKCYKYDADGNKKYFKKRLVAPKPTPSSLTKTQAVSARSARAPKKIIYKEVIFDDIESTIDEEYEDFEM